MQNFHRVSSINETDSESQTIAASHATKSLPPLPRGWSRACHETGLFLRGIGLGIVVTCFQGLFTKNFAEPEKVAIRRSRITALLRTLIHAVPAGVAIFEIALNLKGHFVGGNFSKQNYLQFAAKGHEIAMQASIATILLSYIRHQISTCKGMPFGAVLAGLQFLQVSYLWSVELWSSILSKDFQPRKKACFAVLVLVCIVVAATAGPSSANLLIARQGLWPTSAAYIAVNASMLDIWPDRLDDKKIERDCAIVRFDTFNDSTHCPISDLYYLLPAGDIKSVVDESSDEVSTVDYQVSGSDVSNSLMSSRCYSSSKDQYCASSAQSELLYGWYLAESNYRAKNGAMDGYLFMHKNYYQPYTVASCVADVIEGASDQAPLRFARISETVSELNKDREIVSIPGLTKGWIINNVSSDSSDFHVHWIDLPMDLFNTGIPGAIIVNSAGRNGSSYNITTCTLNAGWGSSTVGASSSTGWNVYTSTSDFSSSWLYKKISVDARGLLYSSMPDFANISNFSYPQRRVSISKDWMEFLNPTVELANNSTAKFISLLLSSVSVQSQPTEENVAQILNILLAVGLSDTGMEYDLEVHTDLRNATKAYDDTCIVFEVESSFYGWSYSARGSPTRLAIAVMFAYCALVFGHIIYSTISGVSSTAWDSTAELVALAMNSSPTEILQNTCAGIVGRKALKSPVRVLVTNPGHLELAFGEVQDPNLQTSNLVMNEKYGKLESEDDDKNEEPELDAQSTLRKRAAVQSSE